MPVSTSRPSPPAAAQGGVRVPAIVRWPGVVARGRVSFARVTSYDLFATFLALGLGGAANASAATDAARSDVYDGVVDGVDLTPLLRGDVDDDGAPLARAAAAGDDNVARAAALGERCLFLYQARDPDSFVRSVGPSFVCSTRVHECRP